MIYSGLKKFRRGFTMMEIMVTVAIIVILVALTVVIGRSVTNSSKSAATKATLDVLRHAMSDYIKSNPEPSASASDWLVKLTVDPKAAGDITKQKWYSANPLQVVDAWGNTIYYVPSRTASIPAAPLPSLTASGFPKDQGYFYSFGPDGQAGGNDDLFSDGVAP